MILNSQQHLLSVMYADLTSLQFFYNLGIDVSATTTH